MPGDKLSALPEAAPAAPAVPEPPKELWLLSHHDGQGYVMTLESLEMYLCCLSEADAITAAKHQNDFYLDEPCHPVRVL